MIKRLIEKLTFKQAISRLSGAYKRLLVDDQDARLVLRDIVGFSSLMTYHEQVEINKDQMLVLEGRRQMAMHILRHIDLDPRELIEARNDLQIQNEEMTHE